VTRLWDNILDSYCPPLTGGVHQVAGWEMPSVSVDAVASPGGSRMIIATRTVLDVVERFPPGMSIEFNIIEIKNRYLRMWSTN